MFATLILQRWRHEYFLAALLGLLGRELVISADAAKGTIEPTGAPKASAQRALPKRDPAEQPFRRAPMSESARSIAIPLATNLHVAFDPQLLRTHTAWAGPSLNLFGPPYHGGKEPFICTYDGVPLWTMPQECPWSFARQQSGLVTFPSAAPRFVGISTASNDTALIYEVSTTNQTPVRVNEHPRRMVLGDREVVMRHFEISPTDRELRFLAHAEFGRAVRVPSEDGTFAGAMARSNDFLLVTISHSKHFSVEMTENQAEYLREVITEAGTESGNPRVQVQGRECRLYIKMPPHREPLSWQVASVVASTESELAGLASTLHVTLQRQLNKPTIDSAQPRQLTILSADKTLKAPDAGDAHYRIERLPLPKEANLMVTGMDFLPNNDLVVCTWTGEVWIVEQATGPADAIRYRRFARGLNEPLGLKVIEGKIYIVQKCELTRLSDTDTDGEADLFENINDAWGYTGNYHSFAFGPETDTSGNFYVALCAQRGRWDAPYLGWAVKIAPDGRRLEALCSGLRAPNGLATFGPSHDLFATDNEGNWVGACKLNHLQAGKFYGYPSAWPAPQEDWTQKKDFTPPAVWFPKRLAPSASGFVEIEDDRFGPFKGQMLVGDFQNAIIMRVMLERVNGEWQGAVWPFARGFGSGVNRLSFGSDGKLYVGGLKNRAWPSLGPREYSLDRVSFTGLTSFEIKEVHAQADGFELSFTEPVDKATTGDAESYVVSQFRFAHHQTYGSPEFDHDGKPNSATVIPVSNASASADGLKVKLSLSNLKPGFVTQFRCADVKSARGAALRQNLFFYTLNQIPAANTQTP